MGYDAVATGHYAQLVQGPDGIELHRSVDPGKDQSYVLGVLDQDQLAHSLFPLGGSTKDQVRAEAAELGLLVADKPDSVDICFIPDGDTAGFLADKLGERPGRIVDTEGRELGTHRGTFRYTIGQRKGLNLGMPSITGRPRYVTGLDPATSTVTVGEADDLLVDAITGIRPTWTQQVVDGPWRGEVQVRAHAAPVAATISHRDGELGIALDEPIRGVAPGQYAMCYDGDRVVGSCVISATGRRP